MGGYTSKEVLGSAYPGTIYDDSSSESFSFPGGSPNTFGRCFIEVTLLSTYLVDTLINMSRYLCVFVVIPNHHRNLTFEFRV